MAFALGFAAFFAFNLCQASDTLYYYSVKNVVKYGIEQGKLPANAHFYFGDSHPPIAEYLDRGIVSNEKSNSHPVNIHNIGGAFQNPAREAEEACRSAALDALASMAHNMRKHGGDAVVNVVSYFKKQVYSSPDQYECHVGMLMTGVAFKGDVVKLK
jgi:uncharacterized protein YbjQ (UPF0145 family)